MVRGGGRVRRGRGQSRPPIALRRSPPVWSGSYRLSADLWVAFTLFQIAEAMSLSLTAARETLAHIRSSVELSFAAESEAATAPAPVDADGDEAMDI